jgi:hypothetical protein
MLFIDLPHRNGASWKSTKSMLCSSSNGRDIGNNVGLASCAGLNVNDGTPWSDVELSLAMIDFIISYPLKSLLTKIR